MGEKAVGFRKRWQAVKVPVPRLLHSRCGVKYLDVSPFSGKVMGQWAGVGAESMNWYPVLAQSRWKWEAIFELSRLDPDYPSAMSGGIIDGDAWHVPFVLMLIFSCFSWAKNGAIWYLWWSDTVIKPLSTWLFTAISVVSVQVYFDWYSGSRFVFSILNTPLRAMWWQVWSHLSASNVSPDAWFLWVMPWKIPGRHRVHECDAGFPARNLEVRFPYRLQYSGILAWRCFPTGW